ncbi:MAG: hypothetical protein ACYDHU_07710 [Acidimicrobiales bacterium]
MKVSATDGCAVTEKRGSVTIQDPPEISANSPMPLDWNDRVPRMRDLFQKACAQSYNVADLPWDELDPSDFTPEQRLGLAYYFAADGTFENSAVPTFAYAMVNAFEQHQGDDVAKMLHTISRDELNHDEICRRIATTLIPGFPFDFEPRTDLERAAVQNMRWICYTNSRFWNAFKSAFQTNRFATLTTNFMMGEAAASLIFMGCSEGAQYPFFQKVFRNIGRDESRHFAFCNYMAQHWYGQFTDEEKDTMTRRIRAAFTYISIVLERPRRPFWDVPDEFVDSHVELENYAIQSGFGLPELPERQEMWKKAALRVKSVTDRHGITFPALPEVGIEGRETPLTEDDLLVVTF